MPMEFQDQVKSVIVIIDNISQVLEEGRWILTGRRNKGAFCGAGNVLFGLDDEYMRLSHYKYSLICIHDRH